MKGGHYFRRLSNKNNNKQKRALTSNMQAKWVGILTEGFLQEEREMKQNVEEQQEGEEKRTTTDKTGRGASYSCRFGVFMPSGVLGIKNQEYISTSRVEHVYLVGSFRRRETSWNAEIFLLL